MSVDSEGCEVVRRYTELGSVEGYIKNFYRNDCGEKTITLSCRIDGNDVECVVSSVCFDVIVGMRVRIHGALQYKSLGILDKVETYWVELFQDESDLPKLCDLISQGYFRCE